MRYIQGFARGIHSFMGSVSTVCALAFGFIALFFAAPPKLLDGTSSEHGVAHADAPACSCGDGGGDAGSCTGGCSDASGSGCSDGGGGCGSGE